MKVLLTSSNTLEFPSVQRGHAGNGFLKEGYCSEESEILLKSCPPLPRRESAPWTLISLPLMVLLNFPASGSSHLSDQLRKTTLQWYRNVCLMQMFQLWHKCLSHSVLLPPPFLFPTFPYTVWLSLRSEVRQHSLESMGQDFSDVLVLGQILLGSIWILSSGWSLTCPTINIRKTGNLDQILQNTCSHCMCEDQVP